jgi:hypothetical protein
MLSFIMAVAIATSSESVDGIRLRGGSSCANGSCSVAAAPVVEKKAETPVKQEAVQATCGSGCNSRVKIFRGRCR